MSQAGQGVLKLAGGFLTARSQRRQGKAKARAIRAMSKYNQRVMTRSLNLLKQKKQVGMDRARDKTRQASETTKVQLTKSGAVSTAGTGRKILLETAKRGLERLNMQNFNYDLSIAGKEQDIKNEQYTSEMKAVAAINDSRAQAYQTLVSSATSAAGSFYSAYSDMKAHNTNPENKNNQIGFFDA